MPEPSFRHKGSGIQPPISSDMKLQGNTEGDSRKHWRGEEYGYRETISSAFPLQKGSIYLSQPKGSCRIC